MLFCTGCGYKKILDDDEIPKPKSIIAELRREFGVIIKYNVMMQALNIRIEMIHGRMMSRSDYCLNISIC